MDTIGLTNIRLEPDELVARAAALKPMLRQRQRETERNRRVSDDTVAQMRGRVVQGAQPARLEVTNTTLTPARCAAEIGAGCGPTAWIYRQRQSTSGRSACTTIGHGPKFGEIRRKRFLPRRIRRVEPRSR